MISNNMAFCNEKTQTSNLETSYDFRSIAEMSFNIQATSNSSNQIAPTAPMRRPV